MKIGSLLALVCALVVSGVCAADATNAVVVASWNIENLFDTTDDPANEGDDGFTPNGWMRWTEARYALKLERLSDIIVQMRPDVLCLAEVENRRVLEDLVKTLRDRHGYDLPAVLHRDCDEKRGIDVAMLAKRAPVCTNWLHAVSGQREVLIGDFVFGGRPVTVVMNHWKSRLGKKVESDGIRRKEAQAVRAYLDGRLRADPALAAVVAGDFNDDQTSPILTEDAGFALDERRVRDDAAARLLLNLTVFLPKEVLGTYYYSPAKHWDTMDSISVTRGMLEGVSPAAPWLVRAGAYRVFSTPAQCAASGAPLPFRRVRNKEVGDIYLTGYSDHFPVRVELAPR